MTKSTIPTATTEQLKTAQRFAVRTHAGDSQVLLNVHDHVSQATIADEVHNWNPFVRTVLVDVTKLKT